MIEFFVFMLMSGAIMFWILIGIAGVIAYDFPKIKPFNSKLLDFPPVPKTYPLFLPAVCATQPVAIGTSMHNPKKK